MSFNVRSLLALLALAACGQDSTGPGPGPAPVHSIAVSPAHLTIAIGTTADLEVILFDADDNVLTGRTITFVSERPQFATVSNTGRVTGIATGTARIFITSEGKTTWVETVVAEIAPAVTSVQVSQQDLQLAVGSHATLAAVGRDAQDQPVAGLPVTWTSNRPGVATVNAQGQVQAVAVGDAAITATIAGRSATVAVRVVATAPLPALTTWRVVGIDRGGMGVALENTLIEQTESYTKWQVTVLDEGTLTWDQANGAWEQRIVIRSYVRTDFQGNTIIGNVVTRTVTDAGASRALSPIGYHEFTSTADPARTFVAVPRNGGYEMLQVLDPTVRSVLLQYARQ